MPTDSIVVVTCFSGVALIFMAVMFWAERRSATQPIPGEHHRKT